MREGRKKRCVERERECVCGRERKKQIQKERERHGDKEIKGSSTNFILCTGIYLCHMTVKY